MKTYNEFISWLGPICENHVKYLLPLLNDKSIVFDIGSNIGLFSRAICMNTKYDKIYLFEPAKEYYEYSKEILLNYDNIFYNNIGISDNDETLILYKNRDTYNIGWNTFLLKDPLQPNQLINEEYMDKEICKLTTLSKFCEINNINNVDLIKIDVEGFEHKVIKGAIPFLTKLEKKPYLFVEVGWGINHPLWNEAESVYNELFKIGYKKINFDHYTRDILFEPL